MKTENDFGEILEDKEALSKMSKTYLMEIAKWSKFFGIIGFIFVGLIAVLSIFAGTVFSTISDINPAFQQAEFGAFQRATGIGFAMIYLLMALLYFFLSLYIFKSTKSMKLGLINNDNSQLEEGFKNLKSTFKFWGVFTAIIVGVYAIIFVFGILGGLFAALAL